MSESRRVTEGRRTESIRDDSLVQDPVNRRESVEEAMIRVSRSPKDERKSSVTYSPSSPKEQIQAEFVIKRSASV